MEMIQTERKRNCQQENKDKIQREEDRELERLRWKKNKANMIDMV